MSDLARHVIPLALVAWSALAPARSMAGDAPYTQEAQLLASDGGQFDEFGSSVAVSGDTVIVGAGGSPVIVEAAGARRSSAFPTGAAYVFVRSGTAWTQQQKLMASDGAPGNAFGCSVSISGDTAIVGARLAGPAGSTMGAAYVFVRSGTTWTEQQKLVAPDGAPADNFGHSVSLSGDSAVIGAPGVDTVQGEGAGAAYVFVRAGTSWVNQQKLAASDGEAYDGFGMSASISGDTIVAGSPSDNASAGAFAGSAYVFVRSGATWAAPHKLIAPDGAAGDRFGYSVSVSGDTTAVGAYFGSPRLAGSAYVFVRAGSTWTTQQKLTAPESKPAGGFGHSISVSGDTVAVGSPTDDLPAGIDAGSAHVFSRSGTVWSVQHKVMASDGAAVDFFGYSVAVAGNDVVVGAAFDDTPAGLGAGSAYVFRPPPPASYFTLTPCRLADTRQSGPALAANSTRTFTVAGLCQVPADALAVAANVTAVDPGDVGDLRLFAAGQPAPLASALNFAPGRTRANNAILLLGSRGEVSVQCDMPAGSTASAHFVLDVFGYFK